MRPPTARLPARWMKRRIRGCFLVGDTRSTEPGAKSSHGLPRAGSSAARLLHDRPRSLARDGSTSLREQ
jgi:hypothetical protein